jgi:endogenous inhibitor of DNA gyrase (YacG/DUF329 family)
MTIFIPQKRIPSVSKAPAGSNEETRNLLIATGGQAKVILIMKPTPKVRCPTCKKLGDWLAGKYGPFCSKRCKLVDLGKWLKEEHRLSEPLRPEDAQQPEQED